MKCKGKKINMLALQESWTARDVKAQVIRKGLLINGCVNC